MYSLLFLWVIFFAILISWSTKDHSTKKLSFAPSLNFKSYYNMKFNCKLDHLLPFLAMPATTSASKKWPQLGPRSSAATSEVGWPHSSRPRPPPTLWARSTPRSPSRRCGWVRLLWTLEWATHILTFHQKAFLERQRYYLTNTFEGFTQAIAPAKTYTQDFRAIYFWSCWCLGHILTKLEAQCLTSIRFKTKTQRAVLTLSWS